MALGSSPILGIDPGLAATGWALLEGEAVPGHGTIRTAPGDAGPRLLEIVSAVERLLDAHPVSEAALEELFMGRNRSSFMGVAQARGAILCALAGRGIAIHEYKPSQVKSVVAGYGMADKGQLGRMLAAQLEVAPSIDEHAADALAIALCHGRSRTLLRMAAGR